MIPSMQWSHGEAVQWIRASICRYAILNDMIVEADIKKLKNLKGFKVTEVDGIHAKILRLSCNIIAVHP